MSDYKKLEKTTHLSGYSVRYSNWFPSHYSVQPFASWANGGSLSWYKAYNDVKHNRWQNFTLANLKNLLDAISGMLRVIYAQIGDAVQHVFESNIYFSADDAVDVSVRSFTITPFQCPDSEKYDFDWDNQKTDSNRFQRFQFV